MQPRSNCESVPHGGFDTTWQELSLPCAQGSLALWHQAPQKSSEKPPILFLHGIFVGAWCWEHFLGDFAQHGWEGFAVSFRGHGNSVADGVFGLQDFVDDAQQAVDYIVQTTGKQPVVVGHSMGGLVLQRLMAQTKLAAAVLLCSMPPQGLLPLAWSNWCLQPWDTAVLGMLMQQHKSPDDEQLQHALFSQAIAPELLSQYVQKLVPESDKLWWQLCQGAPFSPWLRRCPVAVIAASEDALVPQTISNLTALSYAKTLVTLSGFGHGVMLERDWLQAACVLRETIESLLQET